MHCDDVEVAGQLPLKLLGDHPQFRTDVIQMLILILLLIVLLVAAYPTWGYSRPWGYYPSGTIGLILIILLLLMLAGRF